MIGPRKLLRVAAAVTLGVSLGGVPDGPAGSARAEARHAAAPLAVTIDAITPGAIPDEGPVQITGTVVNESDEQYRLVKVYAVVSATPMTTPEELDAAAKVDLDVQVGTRITAPGSFAVVGDLDPGERATYTLRVKRSLLPTQPGVYWLGSHALGETDLGRDDLADGKARTFIPLVPRGSGFVDAALVLQLRHDLAFESDGRLAGVESWAEALAPGGDLADMVTLGDASGPRPVTWVVDPAVPEAVARLAARNPTRFLGTSKAKDRDHIPALSEKDAPEAGAETDESSAVEVQTTRLAKQWLAGARQALPGDDVLALPYGDLDLSAAAANDEGLYRIARRRSSDGLPALEVSTHPVAAPPGGWIDRGGLGLVARRTPLLVTDRLLVGDDTATTVPGVVRGFDRRLLVASSAAASGGPDPGTRRDPIALRQRILAEAALRLLGESGPLVVAIPPDFDPGSPTQAADFFTGLDQPWLRLSTLSSLSHHRAAVWEGEELAYPESQANRELTSLDLDAARRLIWSGRLLDAMLPDNATVSVEVQQEALSTVSYAARRTNGTARVAAEGSRAALRATMDRVVVDASPVTLSGAEGIVVVSVTNQLDQPVRVRLEAATDPGLEIEPTEPIDLAPGERASRRMVAHARQSGVHNVDLQVTDEAGRPVGGSVRFQLRSSQVSQIIWVVFAVGGVLLFSAIGIRLYRRVRAALHRRRTSP